MIYVNFTYNGTTYRISTEDYAGDQQWFGWVTAIDSLKLAYPTRHGGLVRPEFSKITISPDLILEIGDIPTEATIEILEDSVKLFTGTARLDQYDRTSFNYQLYRPDMADEVTASTAYNNTLVNVVSSMCSTLGLTLDSTAAQSPSPAILHTTTSDKLMVDLLSEMCSFHSHGAKIIDSTLYLYDMLGTYTVNSLGEFDTTRASYRKEKPYSLFKSGDSQTLAGSAANGDTYTITPYHTTGANVQTALGRVKTIMEQDIAVVSWKSDSSKPLIAEKFSLLDESLVLPVNFSGIVTSVVYNYQTLGVEVEASGTISLA